MPEVASATSTQSGSLSGPRGTLPYDGTTYYGQPAVKKSHYGWLIVSYFFVGGLAGCSQLIAAIADLRGHQKNKSIVRAGRYLGFAGSLLSPALLVADLHTPRRWLNMLRIFRPTSAMSIGAWTLAAFGTFSGFTAVGQLLSDLFHLRFGRWIARLCGIPAAVAGTVMSFYTGVLLSATSTPLWAAAPRLLPALFGSSAASTAAAAVELTSRRLGQTPDEKHRLAGFSLLASALELSLSTALRLHWRKNHLDAPLAELPLPNAFITAAAVGAAIPLAMHAHSVCSGRISAKSATTAAVLALAGGYALRAAILFAGNRSADRPTDYFNLCQPNTHQAMH
ncbi:MAG TPA: NrfD/PsrC family molybdoenzyme membrane anchor subunit [Pirellulales bacterium]|nr:NrfD/PsrC family molybdoenzyme membrane anchor subunit [Pirellulales bacterium]